jgi:hypothetical protein
VREYFTLSLSKGIPTVSGTIIAQAFDEQAAIRREDVLARMLGGGTLKAEGTDDDEISGQSGATRSNFFTSSRIHNSQRSSRIFTDTTHAPSHTTPRQIFKTRAATGWANLSHDQCRVQDSCANE